MTSWSFYAGLGDREFLLLADERLTFAEFAARVQQLAGCRRRTASGRAIRVVLYPADSSKPERYMAAMAAGAIPVIYVRSARQATSNSPPHILVRDW